MNFGLLLVAFMLIINVLSRNVIALGYLVFAVVLISLSINFYKDINSQETTIKVLRYYLLPYLMLDVFLQLFATVPFIQNTPKLADFLKTIGISTVWSFSESNIYFGQDISISMSLNPEIGSLMLKAISYFLISLQLWMVNSTQFQKFSNNLMLSNL